MKIIRWSFVIPAVIIVAAIVICTILFLDGIIKSTIISSAQMVTGAKVEIDSLKTSFSNCSISIYGFRAADRNNEFRNIADIEKITFDMKFTPLLRKKIVVDDISVVGLKTQTIRKTSGKLPEKIEKKYQKQEKKDSKFSKILDKAKTTTMAELNQLPSVEMFNEIQSQINNFDLDRLIDKTNLQSIKQIEGLSKDLETKYQNYIDTFNNLKLEEKIEDSKKIIDEISKLDMSKFENILKAATKVNELTKNKKYLDEILNQLKSAQKDITQTIDFSKQIKSSLDKDINSVSQQLSIPNLNVKNISKMLFGNKWVNIVEKTIYYINLVKKYMPEKTEQEKKIETQQRQKGRDIIFPQKLYPTFLIYKLNVTGTTSTPENDKGIDFKGLIKNVSTSPSMLQEPITLNASGSQNKQSLKLEGTFDHRTNKSKDQLNFAMDGISGSILNIPQNDYLPLINTATANFLVDFVMEDENVNCKANISLKDIKEKDTSKLDSTLKMLAQVTNSIKSFSVDASAKIVSGNDIEMNISSDIDKKLSNAISNLFSSKVNEVKAKLKEELNKIASEKTKELEGLLNNKKDELLKEIKKNINVIDDIEKVINEAIKKK